MRDARTLIFGPFRVDLADERLWRGEAPVRLTNKAFSVLRHLAQHPARLVTKEELLDAVWPDTSVSEAAMTVCIRELRQALDDDAHAPRFIETVRGRGYRFVAPAQDIDRPAATAQEVAPAPPVSSRVPPPVVHRPVPLVGREGELARLRRWFAAAREGERRVAFVTGEAGIGKTTLVDAFLAQLGDERPPSWMGRGQCVDQYGAGEAYLPLLEALGRMCREPGGERILGVLRQHAPSWLAQMPALLAEPERSSPPRADGGTTPARMLRELAETVETLAAERPLVLLLEDLHWSDASTLAWLAYVARRREAARLLVLGTYRPVEAIVAAHPLHALASELRGSGKSEELLLDYLPEEAVAAYLAGRCPGGALPAGLARALHRRTEGNPLYLVTLVDALVREGKLAEGPGGWSLPGGVGALGVEVPEDLRQLIEHHLARVSPEDQAILEAGSVVGVEFSAAAVAAGVERGVELVEGRCESLARQSRFVQSLGPADWPDGTTSARYRFLHALHRDVLYGRIPAGLRVRWHRQVGLRLEAGHGDRAPEMAAELAEHFVRGRDLPRAVRYLKQAGENARLRSAYREAIGHLTRGVELVGQLPHDVDRDRHEVDLQTSLGLTYMAAKGYSAPEVGTAFARARAACRGDDATELARALGGLCVFRQARAEFNEARQIAVQMMELGRQTNDPSILGPAHHGLGDILFHTGEFLPARDHLEQAFALYSRQLVSSPGSIRSVQDGRVISQGFLALDLWHLGHPDQALRRAEEALAQARELSHPFTLAYALFFMCAVHGHRGEHALALPPNEEMYALSVEHGFPVFVVAGTFVRTLMLLAQGKTSPPEGIAQLRRCIDSYGDLGAVSGHPVFLAVTAELQMAMGQIEEGWASFSEARASVERTGERRYDTLLSLLEGKLLLAQAVRAAGLEDRRAKVAEAEAALRGAVEVSRRQGSRSLELQAVMSLCRLWQQQGRRGEARDALAPLLGWFTEGFETADLAAARSLLESLSAHPVRD